MLKLNCPFCGAKLTFSLFSNKATCSYCGQESLINGIINKQSFCPICQDKDQAQRVSALMQTHDPIAQHVRPPDKPQVPSFSQFCTSKGISKMPEPSRDFKEKGLAPFIVLGIVAAIIMFNLFGSVGSAESSSKGVLIFFAIVFLGLAIFSFFNVYKRQQYNKTELQQKEQVFEETFKNYLADKEKRESNLRDEYEKMAKGMVDKWQLAMKRWEMLYYCRRDHIIYIPGSGKYEELKDIIKYLYSQEQ
jgi:hypothetical protein